MALPRAALAARRGIRRASTKLAVYAAAAALVLTGAGFLLAALVIYLAGEFGILNATLMVGGGLVALGLGIVLASKLTASRPRRFRALAHAEASFAMQPDERAAAGLFEERLAEASGKHFVPLAVAALAMGIAAGYLRGKPPESDTD
ncbi:MAG: hypothetical protein FJX64_11225 [Alphaproteobacteria bacterium]|nr:hypothetical protein [Alphaproteobacteria bacterium]